MPLDPILLGAIAVVGFAEATIAVDLRARRVSIMQFAVFMSFIGAYVFFGLWFSLLFGFYSGPDPHGADRADASVAVANLVLGGILAWILRFSRFSVLARRCLFYAFTLPAWILLLSLADSGLHVLLAR